MGVLQTKYLSLLGRRIAGEGAATETLALQLPIFARTIPEIARCHAGTINLEFPQPLEIIDADFYSAPMIWEPGQIEPESFQLIRCQLHFASNQVGTSAPLVLADGWLYIASQSAHRQTPRIHEFIAPKLELGSHITHCAVVIRETAVKLPLNCISLGEEIRHEERQNQDRV